MTATIARFPRPLRTAIIAVTLAALVMAADGRCGIPNDWDPHFTASVTR